MARNQKTIPGTERKELAELIEKAEAYKALVTERLDMQKAEGEAKDELNQEIRARIEDGSLDIDPDAEGVIAVYKYTDDDGQEKVIKHGSVEKVSVVNAKSDDD